MLNILLNVFENDEEKKEFLRIYEMYNKNVFYVTEKILGSRASAEDAAQDVWLKLIEMDAMPYGLEDNEIKAYLIVMARNRALNLIRKEKKYLLSDSLEEGCTCDEGEYEDDGYNNLIRLIKELPEKYRSVLELKFVMELDNRKIGYLLGINPSTVSSRIFRGKRLLIKKIREQEDFYEKYRI